MTKKSQARLQRDAQKRKEEEFFKNNNVWSDLEAIKQSCEAALYEANFQLSKFFKDEEVKNNLPRETINEVIISIRALSDDIKKFQNDLNMIASKHMNRTGGAISPDNIQEYFGIFEMYNQWTSLYNACVKPTIMFIAENIDAAYSAIEYKKSLQIQAENATNPEVVTDVEPK